MSSFRIRERSPSVGWPPRAAALLLYAAATASTTPSLAADAERGAQLYLLAPGGTASCVGCHGPDPAASRNNLLRAADQPQVLLKTLGAIGAMGYLKSVLSGADIEDLAAYLGSVNRTAAADGQAVWPRTVEFGTLALGAASPPVRVVWRNRSAQTQPAPLPRLALGLFTIEHDCNMPLPPQAQCSAQLRALAGAVGDSTDALSFEPVAGSVSVRSVVGVSVRVRDAATAVLLLGGGGATATATGNELDFGTLPLGQAATRTIMLRNAGTGAATLGVATLTGPGSPAFMLDGACAAATVLLPGQSCAVELHATPAAAVAYDAALQWRSDGTAPQPLVLRLQGQAATVAPPPAVPPMAGGGEGGGGGGCAAAPPARMGRAPVDASLMALLLAALAGRCRRQPPQPTAARGRASQPFTRPSRRALSVRGFVHSKPRPPDESTRRPALHARQRADRRT